MLSFTEYFSLLVVGKVLLLKIVKALITKIHWFKGALCRWNGIFKNSNKNV